MNTRALVLCLCVCSPGCTSSTQVPTSQPPPTKLRMEVAGYTIIGLSNNVDNEAAHPVQARQGAGVRIGVHGYGLGAGAVIEGAQSESQIQHIFGDISHEVSVGGYIIYRRFGAYQRHHRWGVTAMAGAGMTWMGFADGGMFDILLIDSGIVPYVEGQVRISREKNLGRYLLTGGAGILFKTHLGQVPVDGAADPTTRMGGQSVSLVTGIGIRF